jgi:hypothetical protein
MMTPEETNKYFIKLISKESGYFGRVPTYGLRSTTFEYIGYELSTDLLPTLQSISDEERRNLIAIMLHFEIHAGPLRRLLFDDNNGLMNLYSKIAWSHFATIVMFGMLELTIKGKRGITLDQKGKKIKEFLNNNLPEDTKQDVLKRYKVDELFKYKKQIKTFFDVVDHMWSEIRSDFVHDCGIQSKGLEWTTLGGGGGTIDDPIRIESDVPMPEWLQLTWQAILNSYGYSGLLVHPKYEKTKDFSDDTEEV